MSKSHISPKHLRNIFNLEEKSTLRTSTMLDIISYMKLFKASTLVNIFFILVICYLAYHLVYGKFNIQNYLVYKFEEKIWKQKQETLDKNIADVAMDLNALRLGQEDYLEELQFQKNPLPNEGETLIKLD